MTRPRNDIETVCAAKLHVLIEGIADHKMSDHRIEALSYEIIDDLKRIIKGAIG